MAKPIYTLSQIINQIAPGVAGTGTSLPLNSITYTFPTGTAQLNAKQMISAAAAFALYDDLIATDIKPYTGAPSQSSYGVVSVRTMPSTNWGGIGSSNGISSDGKIFFGGYAIISSSYATNNNPVMGSYGNTTFIHEIGHALLLEHPGPYNYAGAAITYAHDAVYQQDSRQYTVMSYFQATNTGANHANYYASTPLLHDIAAIQAIYGADMTTRTGDTVYGFHSTAGRDAFDFTKDIHPIVCIWDAGGNDTIDVSGWSMNQKIDLHQGGFSDVGGLTFNLSIAYGANIENATGGAGHDTLIGNDLSNHLIGGAGNDTLTGNGGNDLLAGGTGANIFSGGAGTDTLDYAWATQGITADMGRSTAQATGVSTDTFSADIERLNASAYNDKITGNALNNVIHGGAGDDSLSGGNGNDYLYAEDGNDHLYGGYGTDNLIGGHGADTFVFDHESAFSGRDTVTDFYVSQGDVINIHDILDGFTIDALNLSTFVKGFASGADGILQVDQDGANTAYGFMDVCSIKGDAGIDIDALVQTHHLVV